MDKLKECPFCGEDDLKIFENIVRDDNGKPTNDLYWFVSCRGECFFAGPKSFESIDEAIAFWNKRSPEYDIEKIRDLITKKLKESNEFYVSDPNVRGYGLHINAIRTRNEIQRIKNER